MNDLWAFLMLGFLVPLFVNEIGEVSSWIAGRLLCWGARRLGSAELAERYSEEWLADLERIPGKLTKVVHAFGVIVWGVPRMRWQFARQQRRRNKEKPATVRIDPPANDPVPWEGLHGSERYAVCLGESRKGNSVARATLINDLTPLVWHVSRGNGLNRVVSEDVTQAVWLAFFENMDTLVDPQAVASWLITTTRGVAQRARRGHVADFQPVADSSVGRPAEFEPELQTHSAGDGPLWRAFQRLPSQYQELLRLTVLAGRSDFDIATEAMGMSVEEVALSMNLALKMLRRFHAEEEAIERQRQKDVG